MKRRLQYKATKRARGVRFVPALQLVGVWLEKAGFQIGQQVNITVEHGKLVISQ